MKKSGLAIILAGLAGIAFPGALPAELPQGTPAPDFTTQGALAGKVFAFNLKAALRKGPVVLYFYPKSFTQGCTIEAHAFAEATADFKAAGASVIGLSADTIETQQDFSRKDCRDKFPVGVATPAIIAAYDVHLKKPDGTMTGVSSRTSYVIGRDGRVKLVYTEMNPNEHVQRTLAAVRALKAPRRR
ncbi:MAG: peroxiredoxin [Sphingomonadaceae bacterium]